MKMNEIKLLFLPHCLKLEYSKRLREEGKKRGYKVYVAPGGSRVEKILNKYSSKYKISEIIGIACKREIDMAMSYTAKLKEIGAIVKPIVLLKDGCKNTEVNLDEVLQVL